MGKAMREWTAELLGDPFDVPNKPDTACYCGRCDGHHGHPDGPSFPVVTLADLEGHDA